MPKTVRGTTFAPQVHEFKNLSKSFPPDVCHPIQALAAAHSERLLAELLDPCPKTIAQPIGNPHKRLTAIFFCAQEQFVAPQSLDVEQHDVGNPQPGMRHEPD